MSRNFKLRYTDDEDVDENGVVKDGKTIRIPLLLKDGKPATRGGRTLDEKVLAPLDSDAAAQAMRDAADAAKAHEDAARDRWLERMSGRAAA